MTKLPLYHETSSDGRGGIPGWWFGAPVVAFAYAFLAPRFVPTLCPRRRACRKEWPKPLHMTAEGTRARSRAPLALGVIVTRPLRT